MAQLVKHLTLDFNSDHDLRVLRSSPRAGFMLSRESASLPLPLSPLMLSLSGINKSLKKVK